jgi:hypothetical protein
VDGDVVVGGVWRGRAVSLDYLPGGGGSGYEEVDDT